MIPRILHQIWVGPEALPDEFRGYRESWSRHHPDWELRLWTEQNLPADFTRKEAYERLRKPVERADIIRLEVLLRFGGVYADMDFECVRSIEPLLEGVEFCTAYMSANDVSNAFIGATAGHPILERAVREVRPRTEHGLDAAATGPVFFSKLVRQHPEATIFPRQYFYPTATERTSAYAINHQDHGGRSADEWRPAFMAVEEKLKLARRRVEELERRRWRNRIRRRLGPIRAALTRRHS